MQRSHIRRQLKSLTSTTRRISTAVSLLVASGHGAGTPTSQPSKQFGWYCTNGDVGHLKFFIIGPSSARWHISSFSKPQLGLQSSSQLASIPITKSTSKELESSFLSSQHLCLETSAIKRLSRKWRKQKRYEASRRWKFYFLFRHSLLPPFWHFVSMMCL